MTAMGSCVTWKPHQQLLTTSIPQQILLNLLCNFLGGKKPNSTNTGTGRWHGFERGTTGSCSCWFIRLPRSLIFLSPARKYWFGKTRKCYIDEQIFSGIWTKHCNLWCGLIQLFSLVGPLCALLCWNTKFPWLTFFEEFHFVGHFAFPLHLLDKRKFWRVLSPMK